MRALAVIALLLVPGLASAQAPTPGPQHRPDDASRPSPSAGANHAAASARTSARHTSHGQAPAHGAPTVRAKPGPNAQRPPAARTAAPAPVAVPPPAEPEKPAEPQKGSSTGLPLPRFAALRSEEVNFRSGPGVRYPIEWVYKRRDLPVLIEREFEVWRLVRDQEGVKGWVHLATLAPRRTAIVVGEERVLHQSADDASAPVAKLKQGVILRLRSCEAAAPWCQAQVGDYRGWIKRSEIWGTFPGEAIP